MPGPYNVNEEGTQVSTTTILHEYERRLNARVERNEITETTFDTYLNDASRIFEVLLKVIPSPVVEGYMLAAGYRGDYSGIIESLVVLAREPGHTSFPDHPVLTLRPKASQDALPGV